jgi:type IV pilus assembly protein PilM
MLSRRSVVTGIDVGHQAVKLVRLENGGPVRLRLTHWGVEEIPATGDVTMQDRALALARLLTRLKLNPRQLGKVAVSIGGRDVYLRQASVPRLSPEDLRRALPYEAKKHLPIENVTQPCLDFQVLNGAQNHQGEADENTQEVLLVAAPEALRIQTLDVLERVGIHPDILDAQPLPTINAVLTAFPPPDDSGWIVILELGAHSSVLAAVLPDGCFYSRPLEFTGNSLTAAIEDQLELDRADAEILKRELGGPDAGEGDALVEASVRALARELEETIRFLKVRKRGYSVSKVYLCGGGALLHGLQEKLSEAIGVEVVRPDPFDDVASGNGRPDPSETPWLVGALGLARWWE